MYEIALHFTRTHSMHIPHTHTFACLFYNNIDAPQTCFNLVLRHLMWSTDCMQLFWRLLFFCLFSLYYWQEIVQVANRWLSFHVTVAWCLFMCLAGTWIGHFLLSLLKLIHNLSTWSLTKEIMMINLFWYQSDLNLHIILWF